MAGRHAREIEEAERLAERARGGKEPVG
jgi:hypothetical protein